MEVRRGTTTYFHDDNTRMFWPTLEDWKATLPEGGGAMIKESGQDKFATTNPILANVLGRLRAHCNFRYAGTRVEMMRRTLAHAEYIHREISNDDLLAYCKSRITECKARIASLLESDKANEEVYNELRTPLIFTLTSAGNMEAVFYNVAKNIIMTRGELLDGWYSYTPLTNPDAPLWLLTSRTTLCKL